MQNRLRSKVTLISLGAQVVGLLIVLGVVDTGMGEKINAVIVALCELLTAFGILNNPTARDAF